MDDISSKIEVVLFDLDLASWHRRPKATLDFSDSRIAAHYQYGINSPNTEVEDISSSRRPLLIGNVTAGPAHMRHSSSVAIHEMTSSRSFIEAGRMFT